MLLWLSDVDSALSQSKPVGGLPETARDQLERFMEVFRELEATGPKVEALLGRGNDYLKKSREGSATNLQNNLRTLKARWENILSRWGTQPISRLVDSSRILINQLGNTNMNFKKSVEE